MFLKMLFIFFLGGRLDKSSNDHLTRVQEALFYYSTNIIRKIKLKLDGIFKSGTSGRFEIQS